MTLPEPLLPTGVFSTTVETEYVLAEDAAYAFVKGWSGGQAKTVLVPFSPTTLVPGGPVPSTLGAPYMWMTQAVSSAGVFVTGAAYEHAQSFREGVVLAWSIDGPTLHVGNGQDFALSAWPYSRGNARGQNSTGRSYYPTMDAAAVAILQEFNPISILLNREFGGRVCVENGKYFSSFPNREDTFSDNVQPSDCPSQTPWVGHYHTHGTWGDPGLSGPDRVNADANPGKAWYVGTPCGWIAKYVGPNGVVDIRLPQVTDTFIECVE